MNTPEKVNFLIAGVGGQGTLLASDIIALVGLHLGLEAKKSEVHGMAQRGGAVVSHVRWGQRVYSPLCEKGTVDYFVAQEMLESLRWRDYLRPGGTVVLNLEKIPPLGTVMGNEVYPEEARIRNALTERAGRVFAVDAVGEAERLGNLRVANIILLGVLAQAMAMDTAPWLAVVEARVPAKYRDLNRRAFLLGYQGQWEVLTAK